MIDVNKITSTLAKLSDLQLQTYAKMNPDPYTIALAVAESNRRKELRAAGQGAQGMQEMPKVVDQAVAEMAPQQLPEDMGIGRLNAGDMNFAGGGIVAFADGGGVERYSGGGDLYRTDPRLARTAELRALKPYARLMGVPGAVFDGGLAATMEAGEDLANMTPEQRRGLYSNPMVGAMAGDAGLAGAIMNAPDQAPAKPTSFGDIGKALSLPLRALVGDPALDTERKQRETAAAKRNAPAAAQSNPAQDMAQFDAASNLYMTERASKQASDAALKAGAGQRTGTGSGSSSGAGAGSVTGGGGASKGSGSLEALFKKLNPSDAEYAALDTKETSVANALKNLGKSGLEEFEAEEAKRGDVFKGREARLAKREGELEGMKDKNLGLALLQAGAAIMSTPGSLGVALGKGVNVGTERYAAGLDKLNAAQERLMDAKDRLEELRVNRDDLTSRERRQLKTQAKQYELEAEKLFLDGAHKKLGYKREDAKNMFAGITTLMGQETAAGATIEAANIRSRDQNAYLAELRGGSMVEQARKNIMADITKNNPYADEPTRQRLFQTEWAKALQSNPALAKYSGVASGGGGASSADPLGLR